MSSTVHLRSQNVKKKKTEKISETLNYFQKSNDMYNRSATDTTFIQKCKEFTN